MPRSQAGGDNVGLEEAVKVGDASVCRGTAGLGPKLMGKFEGNTIDNFAGRPRLNAVAINVVLSLNQEVEKRRNRALSIMLQAIRTLGFFYSYQHVESTT